MTPDAPTGRRFRLSPVALLIAALLLFGVYRVATVHHASPKPGRIWGTGYPQSAREAEERLRKQAASNDGIGALHGNDWLAFQDSAVGWIGLARLTGDPGDFGRAQTALTKAFAIARPGAGPNEAHASLAFALHRLTEASTALDAIDHYPIADPPQVRAEHLAIRGDIAFFRGNTETAMQLDAQALRLSPGPETLCRISQIQWRTGKIDEANASLDACESSLPMRTPQFAAYVLVQRALIALNRGEWQDALVLFAKSEHIFPGDWKTGLRIAMLKAALGDPAGAAGTMEKLARPGTRPEVDDSLANLYRLAGDGPRSNVWAARAKEIWQRRVAQFPEAYWGHARDHELAFGDPAAALRYAIADARNRPYGEPLIGLARAWIANGRADYALALLARVDRTGWKSAEAERVRAEALLLTGKPDAAQAARDAALALDPRAYDPARAFIWLDH